MFVCLYVCMVVCMYVCMYMYVFVCVRASVCLCVCVFVYALHGHIAHLGKGVEDFGNRLLHTTRLFAGHWRHSDNGGFQVRPQRACRQPAQTRPVCVSVCVYAYNVCIHARMHAYTHSCMHAYIHTEREAAETNVCKYTCMHACIQRERERSSGC